MSYARPHLDAPADKAKKADREISLAVPDSPQLRGDIAAATREAIKAGTETASFAISPERLESMADEMIAADLVTEQYRGFAMIMLANAANEQAYSSVSFDRRLLMLPRCLARDPQITALKQLAGQLGYQILMADGTPAVLRVLAGGGIDAICGVACMDSLRRVFATVRQLGAPAMALPLLADGCKDTQLDTAMLQEYIELHSGLPANDAPRPGGYLALLQLTSRIFQPDRLSELLVRAMPYIKTSPGEDTHRAAMQWLSTGGKRLRPFITLAVIAAASGMEAEELDDNSLLAAIAIEAFHKASLAHDDIEDGDGLRYGKATLHVQHGVSEAINIGDYLLGMGYSLSCTAAENLAGQATAILAAAHTRLALGQGEELTWRSTDSTTQPTTDNKTTRRELLRVYALKTAPAFEAALRLGLLLGGGDIDGPNGRPLTLYCRHVGVAFQLINDIDGLDNDEKAKRITFPLALVAEGASMPKARRKTREMIDALHQRAMRCADEMQPPAVGELCRFLAKMVLDNTGDL